MGRRLRFLRIDLILILVAAATASNVFAQTPTPPPVPTPPSIFQDRALTPEEYERHFDQMSKASGIRLYEGLCARAKEFVAKKGAVPDPLLSQFNTMAGSKVVNALLDYCATGRFYLAFYDDDRKCKTKTRLAPIYMFLIRQLPFVRSSDVEIIALGCIETTEKFSLLNPHAHSILINDSILGGLETTGGTLTYNLEIFDAVVSGTTKIEGMSIGSALRISRTAFGPQNSTDTNLVIGASTLGALSLRDSQVNGSASITTNQIKGNAQLGPINAVSTAPPDIRVSRDLTMSGNDIRGDLIITRGQIGRNLDLRSNFIERGFTVGDQTTVKGWLEFFGARAHTAELFDLEVDGTVGGIGARISETMYIGRSSTGSGKTAFNKDINLRNLKVDRLRVQATKVKEQFTLTAMTAGDVVFTSVEVGQQLFTGNARVRTFDIKDSDIPNFDCTDCEISQYLSLGGRFSGPVNLRGAQIRASLLLRDGDNEGSAAAWGTNSHLDLRSVQVETIELDYCDVRIKPVPDDKKCAGSFVPILITGAKFNNIVPGRHSSLPKNNEEQKLREGLLERPASEIVAWIRTGAEAQVRMASDDSKTAGEGLNDPNDPCKNKASSGDKCFQPQAYELVAEALRRAGRHNSAVDVRIAKLDHDYSTDNHNWFMKGVAKVGRLLTGYGYQNERSVVAFCILISLGVVVFITGRQVSPTRMQKMSWLGYINLFWYSVWFSVDRAVPPLHIDESMKQYSVLTPLARAYFYFHRGAGTFIISFFVAGVTGLFK